MRSHPKKHFGRVVRSSSRIVALLLLMTAGLATTTLLKSGSRKRSNSGRGIRGIAGGVAREEHSGGITATVKQKEEEEEEQGGRNGTPFVLFAEATTATETGQTFSNQDSISFGVQTFGVDSVLEGPDYQLHGHGNWASAGYTASKPAGYKYFGGILIGDYMWIIPYAGATPIVKVHKETGLMTSYANLGALASESSDAAFNGALYDGEFLWLPAHKNTQHIKINPVTSQFFTVGPVLISGQKYSGPTLDLRGRIWLTPSGSDETQPATIDRATGNTAPNTDAWPSGFTYIGGKLWGGTFDGRYHYMYPCQDNKMLIRLDTWGDPVNTREGFDGSTWPQQGEIVWPTGVPAYPGGAYTGENKLFLLPCRAQAILLFNTTAGSVTTLGSTLFPAAYSAVLTGMGQSFGTVCLAHGGSFDGRYLWVPPRHDGNVILRLDVTTPTDMKAITDFPSGYLGGTGSSFVGSSFDPLTSTVWFVPFAANMLVSLTSFTATITTAPTPSASETTTPSRQTSPTVTSVPTRPTTSTISKLTPSATRSATITTAPTDTSSSTQSAGSHTDTLSVTPPQTDSHTDSETATPSPGTSSVSPTYPRTETTGVPTGTATDTQSVTDSPTLTPVPAVISTPAPPIPVPSSPCTSSPSSTSIAESPTPLGINDQVLIGEGRSTDFEFGTFHPSWGKLQQHNLDNTENKTNIFIPSTLYEFSAAPPAENEQPNPSGFDTFYKRGVNANLTLVRSTKNNTSNTFRFNLTLGPSTSGGTKFKIQDDEIISISLNSSFLDPCADSFVTIATLTITATPDPRLVATQEAAAVVTVTANIAGLVSPGTAVDAQSLAVLGVMSCTQPADKKVVKNNRLLSPLATGDSYEAMILGNWILVTLTLGLHFVVVAAFKTFKKLETWAEARAAARFPSWSLAVLLLQYQGTSAAAIKILQSPTVGSDSLAMAGITVIFSLSLPFLILGLVNWLVTSTFHRYDYTACDRVQQERQQQGKIKNIPKWLRVGLPSGRWLPAEIRQEYGKAYSNLQRYEKIWSTTMTWSPTVMILGLGVRPETKTGCVSLFATLAALEFLIALVILGFRPFRSLITNVLASASNFCLGFVLVGLAVQARDPTSTRAFAFTLRAVQAQLAITGARVIWTGIQILVERFLLAPLPLVPDKPAGVWVGLAEKKRRSARSGDGDLESDAGSDAELEQVLIAPATIATLSPLPDPGTNSEPHTLPNAYSDPSPSAATPPEAPAAAAAGAGSVSPTPSSLSLGFSSSSSDVDPPPRSATLQQRPRSSTRVFDDVYIDPDLLAEAALLAEQRADRETEQENRGPSLLQTTQLGGDDDQEEENQHDFLRAQHNNNNNNNKQPMHHEHQQQQQYDSHETTATADVISSTDPDFDVL